MELTLLRHLGLEVTLLNLPPAPDFLAWGFFSSVSSFSVFSPAILQDGKKTVNIFHSGDYLIDVVKLAENMTDDRKTTLSVKTMSHIISE